MAKVWMPVEDGKYAVESPRDAIEVEGEWLTVTEYFYKDGDDQSKALVELPNDLRLCRLTDAPPSMIDDVRATIREALGELRHSPASRVASYDDFVAKVGRGPVFWSEEQVAEWRMKVAAIDAALAWLDAKPLDMPDGPGWWAFDGSEWESKPIYLLGGVEYDEWQEEWTEKAEYYWRHHGTEWPKAIRYVDIPGPPFRTIVEIFWVHAGQAVCRPKQYAPHHGEPVLGFLSPKYRWNHAYYTPDNWVGKWYRLYMPWEANNE